jgi:tetratricopeptide (TPR) repeat protein
MRYPGFLFFLLLISLVSLSKPVSPVKKPDTADLLRTGVKYMNSSKYDSALLYLNRSVEHSKKSGDARSLCQGYAILGELYFFREERLQSIKYFKLSLNTDSLSNHDLLDIYNKMGIIYGDAGNIPRSMEFFNKALGLAKQKNDRDQMGYIYANIAGVFDRINNQEKCIEYDEKALSIFREANNIHGQGYILNGLGMTYYESGEYGKAMENYRQALAIQLKKNDFQKVAFILTNLGDLFLKLNLPDSALACYTHSLVYSEKNGDKLSKCCTFLSLGRLYMDRKNMDRALYYTNKSLHLSKEINYRVNLEEIYLLLSEIYDKTGRHQASLACLQKRNAVRDSSLNARSQEIAMEMAIKYETGEKKEEISKLNHEVDEKNAKIHDVLLVSLGIFILATILFITIYYYYRKRLKPKVHSLDLILNQVSVMKEKDSRRMKSLKNIFPSEIEHGAAINEQVHDIPSSLIHDLEALMKEEKIYLDENITLADVALRLKTNTSYLSRLVNDHYQVNFSSFINKFRIEEAKELIRNNRQETLSFEGISRNSGFRSRSSFNQAFKSITGMTPSQFVAKIGKE